MRKQILLSSAITLGLWGAIIPSSADDFTTDFEAGYLRGWTKTGTAFDYQPTLGDNPTARGRGQPSNHQGNWWIGTHEKYQGQPGQTAGDIQGDGPTGTLTSPEFLITGDLFSLLVGGGTHFLEDSNGATVVELEVDGAMVFYATGNNTETMQRALWNISSFKGHRGRIKIIDANSGSWGHINCDDFQMLDAQGRRLPFSATAAAPPAPALAVHPLPSGATWTTTSTTFTPIADSNPPLRTPKSSLRSGIFTEDYADLKITFSGEVFASSGARVFLRALVDGEVASPSDIAVAVGDYTGVRSFTFTKANLAAGGHWVEMQWAVDAGGTASLGDAILTLSASSAVNPFAQALLGAAPSGPWVTTTAGYWDNVPAMTGSLATTAAGNLAITFTAESFTSGSGMYIRALVDGQVASPSDVEFVVEWWAGVRSFTFIKQNVLPGVHDVAIQWRATGGLTSYIGDCTLSVVAAPETTKYGGLSVQAAPSGPDKTTTSASWVDVPDLNAAYIATAANSSLEITFSSELNGSSGKRVGVRALVDGQPADPSDVIFVIGESWGTRSFTFAKTGLSAGPHEVRVQWRVDSGGSAYIGDHTLALNYWPTEVPDLSTPFFELKTVLGSRKVLAILWDPHRSTDPASTRTAIENLLFGPKPSVADYFLENSGGRMKLENAGVLGWYDAAYPASYYWGPTDPGDSNGDGWINPHVQKWAEAIRDADPYFNFAAYDLNGDKYLSPDELGILIIIPQNDPFGTMRQAVGREVPLQDLIADGVKIDWITEAYIGSPPSLGLAAHELAHLLLGAGDMYFYFFQPYAAGPYSLMDQSPNNPGHLDPLHKVQLGWLNTRVVTSNGWYRLGDIETRQEALILYDPLRGGQEFFLVENRWRGSSYDSVLPYSGIAVWQMIEDEAVFSTLPVPPSVDPVQWNDPKWGGWARRGMRMIRPIYGPPYNTALWDGSNAATGYDLLSVDSNPNHVALKWADGTPSGFTLQCMPVPGPDVMLGVTTPYDSQALLGPSLTIQRGAATVSLRWPALNCFNLEEATQLVPSPNWSSVGVSSQVIGDERVVTLPIGSSTRFYRLHRL
jgi:M6 family metalloprotease-like protein